MVVYVELDIYQQAINETEWEKLHIQFSFTGPKLYRIDHI